MPNQNKMGVIVGSLRKDSANNKLADIMIELSKERLNLEKIEIADIPYYNQDLDDNPPREWMRFRGAVENSNCILFVTPEYNHSMPPAIKNALDVGGTSIPNNIWRNKKIGIASMSRGKFSEWNSNKHLIESLSFLGAVVYNDYSIKLGPPETVISNKNQIKDKNTEFLIKEFLEKFFAWAG